MERVKLAAKGFFMGIAEAIPGVSGGTIAFITGIYQELIDTINSIKPNNIRLIKSDFGAFFKSVNGAFLITLLGGMVAGLLFGVLAITHLLETQKEMLWAFFFGLVLASAAYLAKDVKWDLMKIIALIVGAVLSYFITTLTPSSGSENPLYIFLAGSIAISALMLPGVSGSFMLLLFGLYHTVMYSVKALLSGDFSFKRISILASLGLGVLVGLFSFARLLSYLFKNYENTTMAVLIGVLLGSLNKLWPWKVINKVFNKETGAIEAINSTVLPDPELYKIVTELNVLPSVYQTMSDPKLLGAVVTCILGMVIVGGMAMMDQKK